MNRTVVALLFALTLTAPMFAETVAHPTQKQLNAMIAEAKTPADHQKIAAYYREQSQSLMAEANTHARMAEEFEKNPVMNNAKNARGTVDHCKYIAEKLKAKSLHAAQLASEHEQMAQAAAQR